jgi:hypothetical protein
MQPQHVKSVTKAIAIIMDHFAKEYFTDGSKIQGKFLSRNSSDNISYISKNHPNGGHT